jgi:hypothetical protein
MWLALTRPDLVRRLIVADIAPVAYAHSQTPLVDAMQRMDLAAIPDRREAEARLAASGVGDAATRAFLLQSLDLRTDPPAWRINLPVLSATMPQIIGWPGTEGTAPYPGPSLFLSGAQSTYVQPEHRPLIRTLFPRVQAARIPGAGHWLHADRPREFEAAVRAWLGRGPPPRRTGHPAHPPSTAQRNVHHPAVARHPGRLHPAAAGLFGRRQHRVQDRPMVAAPGPAHADHLRLRQVPVTAQEHLIGAPVDHHGAGRNPEILIGRAGTGGQEQQEQGQESVHADRMRAKG